MSQIKGGRADKFGNAFERLWVVSIALDVVQGRATSIKWEPLGPEGAGIECIVSLPDGTNEKHQCKIENKSIGRWSAADLGDVLTAAKRHLEADLTTQFVFVSRDPARVPSDLAHRAHNCDDNAADFLEHCLSSVAHKQNYQSLCRLWGLDSTREPDARVAIGLLRRMQFERGVWERSERRSLYRLAEFVAEGDGKDIVTFLGVHLEETHGNTRRSDDLRAALRNRGFAPRDLANDPQVPQGVERLQVRFCSVLEQHLICSESLARPEPDQLVERIRADGGARLLFVTGDAGSGKSSVLLEAVRLLSEQAVPHLPIRLDTHYPGGSVRAYSKERLELPGSPAACLSVLADGRRAALIIDQLDAVRWTSANSDVGWELCKEIMDEALGFPNISVVVAGRTVDLEDDPRISQWRKGREVSKAVEVTPFPVGSMSQELVAAVVEQYGVSYPLLLPRERDLLSNAQSLQLWWRLAEDGEVGRYSSRAELLGSFWTHYREKAARDFQDVTIAGLNELLDELVEFMDTHGRLDVPNALLDRRSAAAVALRGLGILDRADGTARFAHQSHLDYLTIERVLIRAIQGETTPVEWLCGHDQSLFRRDQVRFLLQLLRDQDRKLYLEFLKDIFFGEGIRFHIQHLALTTLAQAAPPTDAESELIRCLWIDEAWHVHVLEHVLATHAPWLDRLTDDGTIPEMLASDDQAQRQEALYLCGRSADVAPDWFERVLAPHWATGNAEWSNLIGGVLGRHPESDTALVFDWRLERSSAGADHTELYSADELAKKEQAGAIRYLASILQGVISRVELAAGGAEQRRVEVNSERFNNLLDACKAHGRLAWEKLLPVHIRAVAVEEAIREGKFDSVGYFAQDSARQIVSLLHDFLATSGGARLRSEGEPILIELTALRKASATGHTRALIVAVLANAPESLADDAIKCFFGVDTPLDIDVPPESMTRTDDLSPQDPAIKTLRALAGSCSVSAFQRIEGELLSIHTKYERRTIERQLELIRDDRWTGEYPNHFGLPQYALLLALPEDRLSSSAARTLRMWRGEFGELSKYRDIGPIEARSVDSPIRADKAEFVSDDVWVQIVNGEWSVHRSKRRATKDGRNVRASAGNHAYSLEAAGKLNPGRYVRLGLRFPSDADESYYSALLRVAGTAKPPNGADESWAAAPVEDVEALIAHIGDRMPKDLAMGISRVVGERNGESWSEATLKLLREYALHHPHPAQESSPDSSGGVSDSRDLGMVVANSTRCSAIYAASRLLWAHPDLLDWTKALAEEVVEDSDPAVRAASFSLAYAIGTHELDLALSLMARAYEGTNDAILNVQYGPHLVEWLWRREFEFAPIFERALNSSDEKVVELAAYWTTVGNRLNCLYQRLARQTGIMPRRKGVVGNCLSLLDHLLKPLRRRPKYSSATHRVGVVRALVGIAVHHDEQRVDCLDRLAGFLEDEDEKVLGAAGEIFRREGFLGTQEAPGFAKRYAGSAAFKRDPSSLLRQLTQLEEPLLPFADAIEVSVTQLSGPMASATQSVANRLGMTGRDIATVLLRLYQQAEGGGNAELKSRCLDQWDSLLRARVGAGQDVLRKIDS